MAIIQKKEAHKSALDKKTHIGIENALKEETFSRKKGFIRSTLDELRKVQWPKPSATILWSLAVVVLTFILTVYIGFFDKLFNDSMHYAQCTATYTKDKSGQDYGQCAREYLEKLTFRK